MQPVRVGIIDDGINSQIVNLGKLEHNIVISENLKIKKHITYKSSLTHSSICAAIIKLYSQNIKFSSVCILCKERMKGTRQQLIRALEWCKAEGIKVINLSIGTTDQSDFIEIANVIDDLSRNGVIIVAAKNNNSLYTIPACLPNVIGVQCDERLSAGEFYTHKSLSEGIDYCASGRHTISLATGYTYRTNGSNSFAAPLITAMVCNILGKTPDMSLNSVMLEITRLSSH